MGEKATKYDCRKDKLSEVRKCEGGSSLYQFMKLYCNDGVGWRKWPRKRWGRRRKRRRRRRRRRHIGWSAFCESSELRFNCRSDCMNSPSWIHYSSIIYEISLQILTRLEEGGGGRRRGRRRSYSMRSSCILHLAYSDGKNKANTPMMRPQRLCYAFCVMQWWWWQPRWWQWWRQQWWWWRQWWTTAPWNLFCRIEGGVKKVFSPMASKLQETVVRTYEHMFWPILAFKNPKYAVG